MGNFSDLDKEAIRILKQKYAAKQKNPDFLTLPDNQVLADLHLLKDNKITNAAIILVGRQDVLVRLLPQAAVILEYRKSESLVPYTNRQEYRMPFYKMIDLLWHDIDLRNDKIDVSENSYIFNIPYFNEDVIREAINNAIAHRDYRRNSETVIKQYPQKLVITNIGGFPLGVTIDNLLRVPSTPRNRLLADVLAKTGIVERSGQGVDKIYKNTLAEGKDKPDYSHSDSFQVELQLSAVIKDKAFAMFLDSEQRDLPDEERLSVFEVIALNDIRQGKSNQVHKELIKKLLDRNLIEKRGKTRGTYYILSKSYYEFCGKEGEYSHQDDWDINQVISVIIPHLGKFGRAKMKDFVNLLEGHLTRRQVRLIIEQLVSNEFLAKEGEGAATVYKMTDAFKQSSAIFARAFDLGIAEMRKRGEIQ